MTGHADVDAQTFEPLPLQMLKVTTCASVAVADRHDRRLICEFLPHPSLRASHPPHGIGQIVGDDQRAARVDGHAYRSSACLALGGAKACHEVNGRARGASVAEGYEN